MHYTDADYHFVAETLAESPADRDRLLKELGGGASGMEHLLEDERLLGRLRTDDDQLVKISPRLLFAVLLYQVRRDLLRQRYTLEPLGLSARVPVFDAGAAGEVLADPALTRYLVDMLVSFVRHEYITILADRGGRPQRRRLSTLSMDDMIELAAQTDEPRRFPVYRRVADIALFTAGMFADSLGSAARRTGAQALGLWADERRVRGLGEYIDEGRHFYRLAAAHEAARPLRLDRVLDRLAAEFSLVRKPLTLMADRYMIWTRLRFFGGPSPAQ